MFCVQEPMGDWKFASEDSLRRLSAVGPGTFSLISGFRSRPRTGSGRWNSNCKKPTCAWTKRSLRVTEKIAPGEKFSPGERRTRCDVVRRATEERIEKRGYKAQPAWFCRNLQRGNRSLAPGKVSRVLTTKPQGLTADRVHFKRGRQIYFRYGESCQSIGYVTSRT